MVLWFAGMSLVLMWVVFRDPAIDHRLVVVGALLPDVLDVLVGGGFDADASVAHTLVFAVGLMFVVMGITVGRRLLRRRLLAIPIGWFFHLILDPVWSHSSLFWWPVDGGSFGDVAIPAFDRPLVLTVIMEAVGLASLVWAWSRFGLSDANRRAVFIRSGRIDRSLTEGAPPSC